MAKGYIKVKNLPWSDTDTADYWEVTEYRVYPQADGTARIRARLQVFENKAAYESGKGPIPGIDIQLNGISDDWNKKPSSVIKELMDVKIADKNDEFFGAAESV